MGKMAERVEIAQDVLDRLDARRLIARGGAYVHAKGSHDLLDKLQQEYYALKLDPDNAEALEELRKTKVPVPKKCSACIKGGLLVAALDRHNKLYLEDLEGSDLDDNVVCMDYLEKWFDQHELNTLENIFEMSNEGMRSTLAYYDRHESKYRSDIEYKQAAFRDRAVKARKTGTKDDRIMRAIMSNIVANKGYFRITK